MSSSSRLRLAAREEKSTATARRRFNILTGQPQHIQSGNCRLGLVISVIVRSRSSVSIATGESLPRRECRPMASAVI